MTSDSDSTDAPYLTARMSTTNRNGMDRNTSTTRISVESMTPPASPATAPTSAPMVMATKAAKKPISSAAWPPFMSSAQDVETVDVGAERVPGARAGRGS